MSVITKLEVADFKKIVLVDIEATTGAVIIAGRNAQGKSSVLDGIEALLRGAKSFPDVPVRTGSKRAVLRCVLDDGIVIERRITEAGTASLKITSADGMAPQHPQAWLNSKLSVATCDPLAFLRARPAEQAAELRRLTGVDTTDLDAQRATLYAQRTSDGRTARDYAGVLEGMEAPGPDVPAELVASSDIGKELRVAEAMARERSEMWSEADHYDAQATRHEEDKAAALEAAATAEAKAKECMEAAAESRKAADAMTVPDIEEIETRLAAVDTTNAAVREAQQYAAAETAAKEWKDKVSAATEAIGVIDAQRIEMLSGAEWPVEGMGIEEGVVTFYGVPFSQASQSEQLRVGLALALAGKPAIPVALVRDGSHLDDEALKLLSSFATETGAQVWVERVGSGDRGAVVIEDGVVNEEVGG